MQRSHRRLHATTWWAIAILLPIGLAAAFLLRPDPSRDIPPVRLDAPHVPTPGAQP